MDNLFKFIGGAGGNRTHDLLNAILGDIQLTTNHNIIIKQDLFAAKPFRNTL